MNVHLALLAVQVAFASLAIAAKLVLDDVSGFGLVVLRTPAAALLLWVIALARRRWRVPPRELAALAALSVLGIAANQLLFVAGLERTTATTAVVLGTSIPVFTVGIVVLARRERATAPLVGGIAIAVAGAVITIGGGALDDGGHLTGDLLIVANSLCYAAYLVLGRPVMQRLDPLVAITWVMTFGALLVLPFGAADAVAAAPRLDAESWAAITWIVVVATVGTYAVNAWAMRHAPSSVVAVYINAQPPIAAALAFALLGERPGWATAAGAVLIGLGIWLTSRR